ncbi:MAG: VWA domain-containing protein, partial [Phycisphaerales bacterium]
MSDFPIRFEHPGWLLLLLLVPLAWWLARRAAGTLSPARRWISLGLRAIVIVLLAAALAEPSWVKRSDDLAVIVVADTSRSVPRELLAEAESYLKAAADARERPEDRLALVTVAKRAEVAALPEASTELSFGGHAGADEATNLAEGVRMALAIVPKDAAARIVLVSDGNETEERVAEAADLARANGVPIDVLPIRYRRDGEIVFEELRAPTRARIGQVVDLRMTLRSPRAATGRIVLRHDGRLIDLDPGSPGTSLPIALDAGVSTFLVPVMLDGAGAHRFEAIFEPDADAADAVEENNRGAAVVFAGGEGRVLVLGEGAEGEAIEAALASRGLEVERRSIEQLAGAAPAIISGFDLVVLANLPRWAIDVETDRFLASYVHDLGGGLLMMGGDRSFGAGGWIDSETAKAIPVQMDPPQQRQLVRGVLGLILHSCEMAEAIYWSEQVAISAIDALTPEDYVGIITFEWGVANECSWAFPLQPAGDKTRAVAAARRLNVGDMPDFGPAMELYLQGVRDLEAEGGVRFGQRHVIIISDGDAFPPSESLVQEYIDEDVTVTTVMVAGHGSAIDRTNMERLAEFTGGRFYEVTDPKALPEIFIKEAVVVSRSLIVEPEPFVPTFRSDAAGPIREARAVPPLAGYVLTVPADGLARVTLDRRTSESDDPILAWWNHGTGRAVAFTSEQGGRWGRSWAEWPGAPAFWEEVARWSMRPAAPRDVTISTRVEGEEAIVEVESFSEDGEARGFLRAEGRIVKPDGRVAALPLRQAGPGRVSGRFRLEAFGAHLVSVAVPGPDGRAANVLGAVTVPYPREHLAQRDDEARLREIAEKTGGRVLAIGDPRVTELFLRELITVPIAPKRAWDLLVLVALGLFLLDVAVRRLGLEPGELLAPLGRLVGRRPARGEAAVAAWQRARSRAGVERGEPASAPPEERMKPRGPDLR